MKKNILVFGLVSGLILAAYICCINYISSVFHRDIDKMIVGYGAMIIAFSFIYVGTKNYRDKYNGGIVSFGKAFQIGMAISLIGSTFYVVAWLIDYYYFMPDFMDKYAAGMLEEARRTLSGPALQKKIDYIHQMVASYKNPVMVTLWSYIEVLPVGIVISLITALILKNKKQPLALA